MTYPKLAEGNNPFAAVPGNPILAADHNELQSQLAAMLGPRYMAAPMELAHWYEFAGGSTHAQPWYLRVDQDPMYWFRPVAHQNPLRWSIPLLEGQKLTAVACVLRGDATGGEVKLWSQDIDASPAAASGVGGAASNPWDTSDAWTVVPIATGLPATALQRAYFVKYITPATLGADILGMYYTAQFGN
jgi:hypothetical protein